MDLHTLHQDIESGFRQLRDLDPADRRRYIAWRLALLAHIEPLMRPGSLDAWIEPLALAAIDGDKLVLQAPDAFHAQWVARQFALPLGRACGALGFAGCRLINSTTNTV